MRQIPKIILLMIIITLIPVYPIYAENSISTDSAASEVQTAGEVQAAAAVDQTSAGTQTSSDESTAAVDQTTAGTQTASDESTAAGDQTSADGQTSTDGQTSANTAGSEDSASDSSADAVNTADAASTADAVSTAVYLNGSSGDDDSDGLTAETAVKTFARAKELAADLDSQTDETITIYITGTVSISGDITLDGIDAIVKRDASFDGYLMRVSGSAAATLSNITIDGNSEETTGNSYPMIYTAGTLNIGDGTVLQNNANKRTGYFNSLGGAIRGDGGTINMTGGEITNNTANMGAGIFLSNTEMNMSGGVISNNHAVDINDNGKRRPAAGGGICLYGNSKDTVLNLSGSAEISSNTSDDMGGGISLGTFNGSNASEILNMTGGTISGNSAGSAGGGIYVQTGSSENAIGIANISGGTISNNSMTGEGAGNDDFGGGGIYVNGAVFDSGTIHGILNLTNVLIADNEAEIQGGGYAACPISETQVYVNDGAAVYSNTASSAEEIYILASNVYGYHSGNPDYDISPTMLGGTSYRWKYSGTDTEVPYNELKGTLIAAENESLSLDTDVTSDANAEDLAKVKITGNYSATRGGGIGSNGLVTVGRDVSEADVTVNKVWQYDESTDRPDSIQIELYRSVEGSDDDPVYVGYETMTPDSSGNWPSITFSNLPEENSSGDKFIYTVKEVTVEGYTSSVSGDQDEGFTVTNTKTPDQISITVNKIWKGGTGEKAVIHLYADGVEVGSCELNADNAWAYTFTGLDETKDGNTIVYTISEDSLNGYTSSISGDQNAGFTVTNTKEKISIPVTKEWSGGEGSSATVHLLADGKVVASATLTADNDWKHTFKDLDMTDDSGNEINYTLTEDPVGGYTSEVSGNASSGFTVTNTKEKISIPVTKEWAGGEGSSATVHLLADGEEVASATLTANDNWKHTFTDLDKTDADGKTITYTIKEDNVEGYTSSITGDADSGFTVTNTKSSETISIPVKKVWEGGTGDKAVIHLYAGEEEVASCELNEGNNWQYTFTGLNQTKDGETIQYTISEENVDGYSSSVSGNQEDGFIVTNTKITYTEESENTDNNENNDNSDSNNDSETPVTSSNSDNSSNSGNSSSNNSSISENSSDNSSENNSNSQTVAPETGDSSNAGLNLAALIAASSVLICIRLFRRKRM
jgi:hypothetical protein